MKIKGPFSDDLRRIVRFAHEVQPGLLMTAAFGGVLEAVLPFLRVLLSARILDGLLNQEPIMNLVLVMLSLQLVLGCLVHAARQFVDARSNQLQHGLEDIAARQAMTMDYSLLEKSSSLHKLCRSGDGSIQGWSIKQAMNSFFSWVSACVLILISGVVCFQLFMIPRQYPVNALFRFFDAPISMAILLFIFTLIFVYQFRCGERDRRAYEQYLTDNDQNNREFSYYARMMTNYRNGREFRLWQMQNLILHQFYRRNCESLDIYKHYQDEIRSRSGRVTLAFQLGSAAGMILILMKTVIGAVTLGSFLKYTSLLDQLNGAVHKMLNSRKEFLQQIISAAEILKFAEEGQPAGSIPVEKRQDAEYQIQFEDVSFHYPGSTELVLSHLSFTLDLHRRFAVVGRNGAGKTTFIKLLCRLEKPTAGRILLNGIDIQKYSLEEYLSLFSVVFQDFHLFSLSLKENVGASLNPDEDRIWECLQQVGLKVRAERMEKGLDTMLYKDNEEGVDLSGGEAQKLAIARALYKDAPFVILDEPTAALDPVSEAEIYTQFDQMVRDKTSIYISHRLSSCRFCDEILVFDQGSILERGCHDQLVRQSGLYRQMWEAQAQYYRHGQTCL